MSTIHTIGARLFAAFFVLLFCSTAFAGSAKVNVCHIPPDDPENYHTIRIDEKALSKHLAHGDLAGACEVGCEELCNDGNACTIDYIGDCFENGCLIDGPPVDCNDDLFCTTHSCDENTGCEYTDVECVPSDACQVAECNEYEEGCSETPVTCGDGQVCDVDTGECGAPVESCSCFTAADLTALGSCVAFENTTSITRANFLDDQSFVSSTCTGLDCNEGSQCLYDKQNPISERRIEDLIDEDDNLACIDLLTEACGGP